MYRVMTGLLVGAVLGGALLLRAEEQQEQKKYVVRAGTRVPLVLVNSISTKTSQVGDRVYLQTSFPIAVDSHVVIPEGSYVTGTVTQVKRPGRIKGRGELYVRFDSLMLRNGTTRDFRGTVSAVDGSGEETLSGQEGKVEGEATKGKDAGTIANPGASVATIGAIAGGGKGAAIGAGVGAAAGLGAVLLTRGSEVRLLRGTALEMQLDRDLVFTLDEVNFLGTAPPVPLPSPPAAAGEPPREGSSLPLPGRFPRPF